MRDCFRQDRGFQRESRERDQVEAAIGVIGSEQTVEADDGGEQRRDPDDPGSNPAQQLRLRPDAEREQQHSEHEKPEDEPHLAALAQREAQVAANEAKKRRH